MSANLLLLSLGTTQGLRLADRAFADAVERAGASVSVAGVRIGMTGRLRRGYPVTDLVEAAAARRALPAALRRHRPDAVVFSATTAALLAPEIDIPYAVRFDSPAGLNRPGPLNAPLHALERSRFARARLLLPWSHAAVAALPPGSAPAVVVPPPVVPSAPVDEPRTRLAVAYTPDVKAKGLDVLAAAWAAAAVPEARLEVFGVPAERARAYLARCGVAEPPAVVWRGMAPAEEFRAALRRARTLVVAARWEDFGMAQLEALADGALLTTVPADGPYEALAIARELAPELVAEASDPAALAACVRRAFDLDDDRLRAYRAAAAERVEAFRPERIDDTIRRQVLPALLERPTAT
jgi:glycosyltransferase involved in cell wall biosynthesis